MKKLQMWEEKKKPSVQFVLTTFEGPGGHLSLRYLNWKGRRGTQEVRPDARQIKDPLGTEYSNF